MADAKRAQIVIKKKIIGGHAGLWWCVESGYADFITAMMASLWFCG